LAFNLENFTSTRVLPVTQNLTLKLICLTIYIYMAMQINAGQRRRHVRERPWPLPAAHHQQRQVRNSAYTSSSNVHQRQIHGSRITN
jgi:hypothetical protein